MKGVGSEEKKDKLCFPNGKQSVIFPKQSPVPNSDRMPFMCSIKASAKGQIRCFCD